MKVILMLDQKKYAVEIYAHDKITTLKEKMTDKAGVLPFQLTFYHVGRILDEFKTFEEENIIKESIIQVIRTQTMGQFVELSVVSRINPALKTYIRIEEGRNVRFLKEKIYEEFKCHPDKQTLIAINEKRPQSIKYMSDEKGIWDLNLDHEYKIFVYYDFEGTITFKHRVSSDIYKLKIKSNSTIRYIKDKIRDELQIGTVTEIYNQNNVKLSNDTTLGDNQITPADVLLFELLGDFLDHRKAPQPAFIAPPQPQPRQKVPLMRNPEHYPNSRAQYDQHNYAQFNIPRQHPRQQHPPPPQQQQQQQQQQQHYQPRPQQFQPQYQPQDYKYPSEQRDPYTPNQHGEFVESGRHDHFQQRNQRGPEPHPREQNEPIHKQSVGNQGSTIDVRDLYDHQRGPFLPPKNDNWFGGGTYNPTTDEPIYQRVDRGQYVDQRPNPNPIYATPPVVARGEDMTDGFLAQVIIAAENEWQKIGTILLNDFPKILQIMEERQQAYTSSMCVLREWKSRWQTSGPRSNAMPYTSDSLIFALKGVGREDLVHKFFPRK